MWTMVLNYQLRKMWYRIAILLVLTSCSTPSQQLAQSLKVVEGELVKIEQKAPQVKPEVAVIRSELTKAEQVVTEVLEEPSHLETYAPWVLLIAGLGIAYFGISTPDPWDTPFGIFMCGTSFVVAQYFKELVVVTAGLLIFYLIYIGAKYYASKGTNVKE